MSKITLTSESVLHVPDTVDVPFITGDGIGAEITPAMMKVIDAAVSRQFLAWIISLGPGIRITGPARVVEAMRREVCRLSAEYGEGTP